MAVETGNAWVPFLQRYGRSTPDFEADAAGDSGSAPEATTPDFEADAGGDSGSAPEATQAALSPPPTLGDELRTIYPLAQEHIDTFRAKHFVRLKNVVPPEILAAVRERIIALATPACGGVNPSLPRPGVPLPPTRDARWAVLAEPATRSWHLQMMWAVEPTVRSLVLSPRIGGIVAALLGCEERGVRLYHDNTLSRAPGCKRTRWHCDDGPNGYMAMASSDVVTVWIPLQRTTPAMGSLCFAATPPAEGDGGDDTAAAAAAADDAAADEAARAAGSRGPSRRCDSWSVAARDRCPANEQSDAYDAFVARALQSRGLLPDEATYELGDISIHRSDCFHTAGPNLTESVRMIVGTTYFASGATMRDDIDLASAPKGIANDWAKFCPGVQPGEPIATRRNPLLEAPQLDPGAAAALH